MLVTGDKQTGKKSCVRSTPGSSGLLTPRFRRSVRSARAPQVKLASLEVPAGQGDGA